MNKLNVLILAGFLFGAVGSCVFVSMNAGLKDSVVHPEVISDILPVTGDGGVWHDIATFVNVDGKFYMKEKDGSLVPLGAEATVSGAGFLSIYFCNHSAAPATCYNTNTSTLLENFSENVGGGGLPAYSKSDGFNIQLKANTAFDIVVRCKFIRTAGPWNGTRWIGTNVRVNMTISGDITMSNALGSWIETYNSSSSQSYYGNAYWCSPTGGTGSGMTIHPGYSITVSQIVISAKY